jgi:hypothetical protein
VVETAIGSMPVFTNAHWRLMLPALDALDALADILEREANTLPEVFLAEVFRKARAIETNAQAALHLRAIHAGNAAPPAEAWTAETAASRLGIHRDTLYAKARRGEFPYASFVIPTPGSRSLRWSAARIEGWLRAPDAYAGAYDNVAADTRSSRPSRRRGLGPIPEPR